MELICNFLGKFFSLLIELTPVLLVAVLVVGQLKTWIPENKVLSWLGGNGTIPIIKATLIGIFLPLCSCSVIPAASQLKKVGVANGTIVAFLISGPAIGINSLLISIALFGYKFTAFRIATIAVTALLIGLAIQKKFKNTGPGQEKKPDLAQAQSWKQKTQKGLQVAKAELWEIKKPFVKALLLAAGIVVLIPSSWFSSIENSLTIYLGAIAGFLIVMILVNGILVASNLCAVDSTPVIFSMLTAGMSPGLAMLFLTGGPAIGSLILDTVRDQCGKQVRTYYLLGVSSCSMVAAYLVNWWF